jgi:transposase-like protein
LSGSVETLAHQRLVGCEVTKLRLAEFKWRRFEPSLILMAVGWYLRFSLSYRDVEELLRARGISADHVTVWR